MYMKVQGSVNYNFYCKIVRSKLKGYMFRQFSFVIIRFIYFKCGEEILQLLFFFFENIWYIRMEDRNNYDVWEIKKKYLGSCEDFFKFVGDVSYKHNE
jgi:hypothetical protein